MLRKVGALAVMATLGLAHTAQAAEHTIMIMGDAYFPMKIYANDGDTVRFINSTDTVQSATAVDDSWTIGELAPEGEVVITAVKGMKNQFVNLVESEQPGVISFAPPPTE